MTNRGAWTSKPVSSGKVTVPAGYHNGSGYVDTSSVYSAGVAAGSSNIVELFTLKCTSGSTMAVQSGNSTHSVTIDRYNDDGIALFNELKIYDKSGSGGQMPSLLAYDSSGTKIGNTITTSSLPNIFVFGTDVHSVRIQWGITSASVANPTNTFYVDCYRTTTKAIPSSGAVKYTS